MTSPPHHSGFPSIFFLFTRSNILGLCLVIPEKDAGLGESAFSSSGASGSDRTPAAVHLQSEEIKLRARNSVCFSGPGGELRLAGLGGSQQQHHAAGASGSVAGPAGGKGGTGEPEPGEEETRRSQGRRFWKKAGARKHTDTSGTDNIDTRRTAGTRRALRHYFHNQSQFVFSGPRSPSLTGEQQAGRLEVVFGSTVRGGKVSPRFWPIGGAWLPGLLSARSLKTPGSTETGNVLHGAPLEQMQAKSRPSVPAPRTGVTVSHFTPLRLPPSSASRHANPNTLGLSRLIQSMISERREPFPLFFPLLVPKPSTPPLSSPSPSPSSSSVCLPKSNAEGEDN
ncbi:hypothetical protein EYF80_007395 [Liparis tanakae]|uniref:Uncharacterized protein n=1 Tax=Liparis tanakae TaxID=230148 RepID=A0A4Z2IWD3_9TELE|nr:hypothetical protein EYF80_007395 [Liparis tanakae]